ncbi:hypothetical protein J4H86_00965 [Spiractinospora alimapuensis]|uniref:SSI family serine proteinase inhibitor n=1 Tax=Spiractinospora alimapuensis TaxID=2820884 RepID=UPI001F2309B4|nr:SSI family serine proteinase inhibitor [Spiractinospora alimapuensis]QVQ52464.1 hypothetical protein J4H86_00965 [Spiractinospora alimapuensis]
MRMHRFGTVLATVAVGGFAGVLLAGPAGAETSERPDSQLRLSIAADSTGMTTSWTRGVTLDCGPAGGSHPNPDEACAALEEAGGSFEDLAPVSGACTMEYAPVRVTARGHWEGTRVTFEETYSNPCHASNATAGIFGF